MPSKAYDVDFWETKSHSAQAAIGALSDRGQAKTYALLEEIRRTEHGKLHLLKKTKQDELWEYKARVPEGGLRVLFAYGKGKLWCLGAFTKNSDVEGNKLLKNPYEKLAIAASEC